MNPPNENSMSKKITISVPKSEGTQIFDISRKALLSTAFLALAAATGYVYTNWTQELAAQEKYDTLIDKLSKVEQEKNDLEQLYTEQVGTTHSLSQELEDKNSMINILGRRVYDVEAVLGIADPFAPEEGNLENRIDAAAIDSAVRATLFRMIPNDSPLDYDRISSHYGRRTNPISGIVHIHKGIDLTCDRGDPIYAPADAVVESVRPSSKGFGNYLTLRHSYGFTSTYAHLSRFKVRSGQFISKGDLIGNCGTTGNSTGPHLHYEVRFLGRPLNPYYTMQWTPENFNYLFEKEKTVKWAPLVQLIDNTVRLQVNLTNNPYVDDSVNTVKNEDVPKPVENVSVQ